MPPAPNPASFTLASRQPVRLPLRDLLPIFLLVAIGAGGCGALVTRWQGTERPRTTVKAQSDVTLSFTTDDPLLAGLSVSMKQTPTRQSLAGDPSWTIFFGVNGRNVVRVNGECRDGRTDPEPIVIRTDSATGARLAGELAATYQSRGWTYRIISKPPAPAEPPAAK